MIRSRRCVHARGRYPSRPPACCLPSWLSPAAHRPGSMSMRSPSPSPGHTPMPGVRSSSAATSPRRCRTCSRHCPTATSTRVAHGFSQTRSRSSTIRSPLRSPPACCQRRPISRPRNFVTGCGAPCSSPIRTSRAVWPRPSSHTRTMPPPVSRPPAEANPTRRDPGTMLARWIKIRDRTCRAPGCRVPARVADIDHTTDHANGGLTMHDNLAVLCRHHHRLKHEAQWHVQQPTPGTLVWISPQGRRYVRDPDPP
jgi:hypothetical protein